MYIGRYAPSPTGDLHLGNARTALIAWLWARHAGGRLLLRFEDLDAARVRDGCAGEQAGSLAWLGLDWDGEPVAQSQRGELYDAALARLHALGRALRVLLLARATSAAQPRLRTAPTARSTRAPAASSARRSARSDRRSGA